MKNVKSKLKFSALIMVFAVVLGLVLPACSTNANQQSKTTVNCSIVVIDKVWLDKEISLDSQSTVYDVLATYLAEDFKAEGLELGYVSAITNNETGERIAELDYGEKSGWMFEVNDEMPSVGIKECTLQNGDKLAVFYVQDWSVYFGMSEPQQSESDAQ